MTTHDADQRLSQRTIEGEGERAHAGSDLQIRTETPSDLAGAGYRIEVGGKKDGDLVGRFWWTWSNGGDVIASEGDWTDPQAAILNARSNWSILGAKLKQEEACGHDEAGRA